VQFASLVVPTAAPAAAVQSLRLQHINFQQQEQQGQQWPPSLAQLMPQLEALYISSQ
jgi:hypothetical protein